jgi:hypothetical protein
MKEKDVLWLRLLVWRLIKGVSVKAETGSLVFAGSLGSL